MDRGYFFCSVRGHVYRDRWLHEHLKLERGEHISVALVAAMTSANTNALGRGKYGCETVL